MTQTTWSGGPTSPPNGRAAPGTTIGGRYALRAAVGNGGMGTVWKAADTLLRRDVAVKEVILPHGLASSDRDAMYERTMREARAAAALSHPAVVQVYDVVTEAGRPWIVMELLDARSLADMVIEDGPMGARAVAKIGIALLGALEVAHAAGVLHRDVKPANVLICNDGRCVLTDFGVARMPADVQLTTPGMVLGSPHFISPERAMGSPFGPPSDLFSLGVTLYTAVEGRPPFDKGDPIETMHAVVEEAPSPPVLAGVLTQVLFGLLEKDPARRWDVPAARGALRELLAGPLASTAPVHQMTDPYAVVPAQRASRTPPTVTPAPQTGQIGGRAMLAPGESLNDRLTQRQPANAAETTAEGAAASAYPAPAAHSAPASPGYPAPSAAPGHPAVGQPTQLGPAYPNPGYPAGPTYPGVPTGGPASPGSPSSLAFPGSPAGGHPAGPGYPPGSPYQPQGWQSPAGAGWPPPPGGMPPGSHAHASGGSAGALAGLRQAGTGLLSTVKGWPRRTQLIAGAGVAVLLVLGIVALNGLTGGSADDGTDNPAAQQNQTAQNEPSFPVQVYRDRGVSVNVPKDWSPTSGKTYVTYTDPDDSGRRVRILVESASARTDPNEFMRSAENNLKKNESCPGYARTSLTTEQLANQTASQLEYTCGQQRHGIWRATLQDGKAYSFFLTVEPGRFAESKAIFDEMVRSFQFTTTN